MRLRKATRESSAEVSSWTAFNVHSDREDYGLHLLYDACGYDLASSGRMRHPNESFRNTAHTYLFSTSSCHALRIRDLIASGKIAGVQTTIMADQRTPTMSTADTVDPLSYPKFGASSSSNSNPIGSPTRSPSSSTRTARPTRAPSIPSLRQYPAGSLGSIGKMHARRQSLDSGRGGAGGRGGPG